MYKSKIYFVTYVQQFLKLIGFCYKYFIGIICELRAFHDKPDNVKDAKLFIIDNLKIKKKKATKGSA